MTDDQIEVPSTQMKKTDRKLYAAIMNSARHEITAKVLKDIIRRAEERQGRRRGGWNEMGEHRRRRDEGDEGEHEGRGILGRMGRLMGWVHKHKRRSKSGC